MANTPNRGIPRPVNADPATIVTDLKESLEWIDQDLQTLSDSNQTKVTGIGANKLWVGTYTDYDLITSYDPDTVYIIRGGERSNPGKRWGLGVPTITMPATDGVASYIIPTLPPLGDDWGYLAIIVGQNSVDHTWWVAPDGWTRLADQSDDEGSADVRPMGIFSAPAGTPTNVFNIPLHGQGRHIAMVFPCKMNPTVEGFTAGTTGGAADVTIPAMVYQNPAHSITIANAIYAPATNTTVPTMTGADYNQSNPSPIVIGENYLVLHIDIADDAVSYAGESTYDITKTPLGMFSAWRVGVGSA